MKSWIESANASECPFPIQNLPYGIFSTEGHNPRCGVAIGDVILDLFILESEGTLKVAGTDAVFGASSLNPFMALGSSVWHEVREQITDLLRVGGNEALKNDKGLQDRALIPMNSVEMHMPFMVAGYTDFYSARNHAFNVGSMFRDPENALPPNWLHIPIGYNGRASTVVVSGTDVRRPLGQTQPPGCDAPIFGPSKRLDIELEMGVVVGTPNEFGQPITVAEAEEMIFGFVLLNDWSARDVQKWEYQPLGPFQAKAFATSISPWVVTKAALEPFKVRPPERDHKLLPYLNDSSSWLYDINLEVTMQPEEAGDATTISRTNSNMLYYTAAQQLTHHAISGCVMQTGDLLGTGTISGEGETAYGSLLELCWGGKKPITLDTGETRTFLEDGDLMTLRGWAQGSDYRIGFGECSGKILPAPPERNW